MSLPALETALQPVSDHQRETADPLDKGVAAIVLFVVGSALVAGRTSPIPYLWIAIASIIVLSYATIVSKSETVRALCLNLAVACLVLGAAESYFWAKEPLERRMDYSDGFFLSDDVLGYAPAPDRSIRHRAYADDQPLYDVTYHLDSRGLRRAMPVNADQDRTKPCLAFFGDSFTFGEGMPDERTMPYQVGEKVGPGYRVVNFGFLGYGPHQMLAALEAGQLQSRGQCRPNHILYQAIPTHVSRAAGLESWDQHGPNYVLDSAGGVRRAGRFDDRRPITAPEWLRLLHRNLYTQVRAALEASALYRTVLRSHRLIEQEDIARFTAIVETAKHSATHAFPATGFSVLFWDYDDDTVVGRAVQDQLRARGLAIYPMSTILPGFPAERARYEISPYDRHPNAQAHALIADYVAHHIVSASR